MSNLDLPWRRLTSRWRWPDILSLGAGLWLAATAGAWAQSPPAVSTASQPTPLTERGAAVAPTTSDPGAPCPTRPAAGLSQSGDVLITLDPDTLWRPRGGEVHFKIEAGKSGSTIAIQKVQVCLGWSRSPASDRRTLAVPHDLFPSPIVRPIAKDGSGASFGATVPDLKSVPSPWLYWGAVPDVGMTAIDTVPVADMVVVVTLADGKTAEFLLPVGVTSVSYAVGVVAVCLFGFLLAAWLIRDRDAPARDFILNLVSSTDGYGSLSQFQILLWTVTIGLSTVYVMVLSGNLINLTSGTLVLLGIASAAALAARLQPRTGAPTSQSASPNKSPKWSDLVVVAKSVDLTRVQMLVFTLITAAFVTLKVVTGYIIPEIPVNFLLLMGISNGVYITGRQLPNQEDGPIKASPS
ncbi:hypothetical protein [Methylobacterium sp. Gmos1]